MRVHWCWIHRECRYEHRAYDAPYRLSITVRDWYVMIGTRNGKSQTWNPWAGTTKTWRRVSIHPPRRRYCGWVVSIDERRGRPHTCNRLEGHRGEHRACIWTVSDETLLSRRILRSTS